MRARHDGVRRNPWNEIECGNHYARSLASWAVLAALAGVQWDVPARSLTLAPRPEALRDGTLRCFFSTARGWGVCEAESGQTTLRLLGGTLDLAEASVVHPDLGRFRLATPTVLSAGQTVRLDPERSGSAT